MEEKEATNKEEDVTQEEVLAFFQDEAKNIFFEFKDALVTIEKDLEEHHD